MQQDQYDTAAERLMRRLDSRYLGRERWDLFRERLIRRFPDLYALLAELYGSQYDFHIFLEALIEDVWGAFCRRSERMVARDRDREGKVPWFCSEQAVGAVCYVDRFAGTFRAMIDRIPYLQRLGINYLHLMPVFRTPKEASDGGYAVADYRSFQEELGSTADLEALSGALQDAGIALSLDFVLNHTSNEHEWARQAVAGDPYYRKFYYLFTDYREVVEYGRHLRDIFPEVRKGSFTWSQPLEAWVWTTFNDYQWDLNYRNHEVFRAMIREMLFLANIGADVLRFDAVAFMWKEKGTRCESLPKVHTLIKAFKQAAALAVPSLAFKSEAIVHPDEVVQYIGPDECELSYNPLLMALSWEALAVRNPRLLRSSISRRLALPRGCAWVNYVRCHDDIGWTFDDGDASESGIDGQAHRSFLNDFFTGRYPGSFARGLPFQENLETGDCRISGTCASLAGLEQAIELDDPQLAEHACRRISLLHGLAATIGGMPLLYLGDELGMLNDYGFSRIPELASDSRWVHRPEFDWSLARQAIGKWIPVEKYPSARPEGIGATGIPDSWSRLAGIDGPVSPADACAVRVFRDQIRIFEVRKKEVAFIMGDFRIVDAGHRWILGYARTGPDGDLLILANFSDDRQILPREDLFSGREMPVFCNLLTGRLFDGPIELDPWDMVWLKPVEQQLARRDKEEGCLHDA